MKTVFVALTGAAFLAAASAHAEITCQTEGRYTHCWDAQTGATVSTTEHGPGSADHTWTPDGRQWTTQDGHTWQTQGPRQ
jgi:hypothetical protein